MVVYGLEISTGPFPTRAHAARAGPQAGGAIRLAAMPTPMWAAVRGGSETKWPGVGAGLEEAL